MLYTTLLHLELYNNLGNLMYTIFGINRTSTLKFINTSSYYRTSISELILHATYIRQLQNSRNIQGKTHKYGNISLQTSLRISLHPYLHVLAENILPSGSPTQSLLHADESIDSPSRKHQIPSMVVGSIQDAHFCMLGFLASSVHCHHGRSYKKWQPLRFSALYKVD